MNNPPDNEQAANRNIVPCKPNVWESNGKNFSIVNAKIHSSDMQNDEPKFFIFSGRISEIIKNGSVMTPKAAIKMVNEKLQIGIQLNESTS